MEKKVKLITVPFDSAHFNERMGAGPLRIVENGLIRRIEATGSEVSYKEIKEDAYHMRERRYGSFMRSVSLPAGVKAETIEAKHEDGVLTVRLPRIEADKPKKIAVKAMSANGK